MTTMTLPMFCPSCLDELPDDYPFDHVLIDRALGREPGLFTGMRRDEKRELIAVARSRGMTDTALSRHFHRSMTEIQRAAAPAAPRVGRKGGPRDQQIIDMWRRGMSARRIARELGMWHKNVQRIQKRLGLPANHEPSSGALILQEASAA